MHTEPPFSTPRPAFSGRAGRFVGSRRDAEYRMLPFPCPKILVTEPVDVVIGDGYLHVIVEHSTVTLMRFESSEFLGDATAVNKDGAVLRFSTK